MTLSAGVVIRTSPRWDNQVRHLGYEPIAGDAHGGSGSIPTDIELIRASQERLGKVKIIPARSLTPSGQAHLRLARGIARGVDGAKELGGIHAAIIPPASDRVRTVGMYSRGTGEIYIGSDQLERGQTTVDTLIHEIAHHTSGAEDGEEAHNSAMAEVAASVAERAERGEFDKLLGKVEWYG